MSTRNPAHCQDALRWLKNRHWNLAPLTGQDRAAIQAISHCWQFWTRSDDDGRRAAIDAVAALLNGCQEVVWPMARELIAQAGDWGHRDPVWAKVVWRFEENLRLRYGTSTQRDHERIRRLRRCHVGISLVHQEGE
jgi:hypothetical protein